jgi:putative ABC transport system permease protein
VGLGFEEHHLLTAEIVLPETRYSDTASQAAAFTGIVRELNATPGIKSAAFVIGVPLKRGGQIGNTLTFESLAIPADQLPGARWRPVDGDYFGTMGLPILAGRPFSQRDDGNAVPVAIVNQTLAQRFFPDRDPIGERIAWRPGGGQAPRWMTIVGVAGDVQAASIGGDDVPAVYTPYLQRDAPWLRFGFLVARTGANPEGMARAMEEAVWRVDATVPLTRVETMTALRGRALGPARFIAGLVGIFAIAAMFIAGQGLYGLLAFLVSERRQELGIRMALGATRRVVWQGVVATAVALTGAGLVLGLTGAVVVTRFLRGLLFQVDPLDPITYIAVIAVLLVSAAVASLVPAGRATRADPAAALRAL